MEANARQLRSKGAPLTSPANHSRQDETFTKSQPHAVEKSLPRQDQGYTNPNGDSEALQPPLLSAVEGHL